jgi:tetratricopeptide (TPR) repeat protein
VNPPSKPHNNLCVYLVAFAALASAACGRSPQEREARYLENGKRQMLKKDYPRAALQFRSAIQAMPGDAEPYYQLALANLADGQLTDAIIGLKKATDLNPRHAGAQVKLAELMALSGVKDVYQEGENRMRDVLRLAPDNVDALDALALNELALGKQEDALQHLQDALEKAPVSVRSWLALAQAHLKTGDLKGAEDVLRKAANQAPNSVEITTGLGEIYSMAGRWPEAEAQFHAALKTNPQFALALLGLVSAQLRQGHRDLAEQTYRTIAALPDKQYRHLHASYLLREGKRDAAIKELEELTKRYPGDRDVRTRLIAAYITSNRVPDAQKILAAALKSNPKDSDALLQRSSILLQSGKYMEAESDLLQASKFQPDSPQVRYFLAAVYEARGDRIRQRQELNEAVRLSPAFLPARIQLARALLAANSAKEALIILDAAPREQKRILGYVIQRNWVLLALNDRTEARKWVDSGLKVFRAPELVLQNSVLKLADLDYEGARSSSEEALKLNPGDPRAMRVLAATFVGQKQPAAAVRRLEEYAGQHPQSAPIQQFVGEWLAMAGQPDKARVAFAAAKAADPHFAAADLAMAKLDVNAGKLDEARKTLEQIIAANGENVEARRWLGSLEFKAGNYEAARDQFQKILDVDPQNIAAINNLAYILGNYTDSTDEALGLAQKAREGAPDNLDAEGTLGWVLYRKGMYREALAQLEDAVAKDESSASLNAAIRKYHLAMTYLKLGDRDKGQRVLAAAVKINPQLPEARMAYAVMSQR